MVEASRLPSGVLGATVVEISLIRDRIFLNIIPSDHPCLRWMQPCPEPGARQHDLGGGVLDIPPFCPGDSYLSLGISSQGSSAPTRTCGARKPDNLTAGLEILEWEEMMDEQAEGLKALLTFLGGGDPQLPQRVGHSRKAAPHPILPLASPACWGLHRCQNGEISDPEAPKPHSADYQTEVQRTK